MAEPNRFGIILLFMIILLLTPDTTPPSRRSETEQAIEHAKRELEELRNSTYGVPGNITGLEDIGRKGEDGVTRMMPPARVRQTVEEMIKDVFENDGSETVYKSEDSTVQVEDEQANLIRIRTKAEVKGNDEGINSAASQGTLSAAHERRDQVSFGDLKLPFYFNASGGIHGTWQRLYDIESYRTINSTKEVEKNVTGSHGRLVIRLEEAKPGSVQEVEARISIENEDRYKAQDIVMYGAHFVERGDMILTTTSREFSGLFALPHFARTEKDFQAIRKLWNESISEAIQQQEKSGETGPLWPSEESSIRCEYIAYLQLHPIRSPPSLPNMYPLYDPRFWYHYFWNPVPITSDILREIEQELRHPTGAPLPPAPPIILSSIIYSPNCGFVLGSKHAKGLKIEMFHTKVRNFALCAAVIIGIQTWLLIRQMNQSSTPSTVSRVSFWSIAMMAIVDGYIAGAFILVSVLVESSYLALVTAAFLSFVLMVVFGMRFLVTIWGVQRPERRAAAAAAAAAAATATAQAPPGTPLELPTPATAQTPLIATAGTDTTNNNTDDGRQDISTIYSRFYFVLIGGSLLFLHVASWPPPFRHVFVNVCVLLACSFWVPQIYRNVMRGCRKALSWEFVVGTSIARLLPVLYLICYKNNIFSYEGDARTGIAAAAWLAAQVGVLWLQEWAGPRFFVPSHLLPPAYDYHPILPIDDLEAAQPFSSNPTSPSSTSPTADNSGRSGIRSFDCAICMHPVDVLTSGSPSGGSAGSGGLGGLTTRRSYMVTPCRHVFHAPCLEGWMRFRLQCPICRNQLPPL